MQHGNDPKAADVDLFCSGCLLKHLVLLMTASAYFFDGDKRVLGQLSEHLSNSGMHLMQKGTVNRGDLENLGIGVFFAKEK